MGKVQKVVGLLQQSISRAACLTLKMSLALQLHLPWGTRVDQQHRSIPSPLRVTTSHKARTSLPPRWQAHSEGWKDMPDFFPKLPRPLPLSTFSSSCQEHAWEWRVSKWGHLVVSASTKTHNPDFIHKCSKDIKGFSTEMEICLWSFPKRKNYFKYGSAFVEERSIWEELQEKKYFCKSGYDMSSVS